MKRIDPRLSFVFIKSIGSYDPTVGLGEPFYRWAGFSGPDGEIVGFRWTMIHDPNGCKNTWFGETWRFSYEDIEYHSKYPDVNTDVRYYEYVSANGAVQRLALFKPKGDRGILVFDNQPLPEGILIERDGEGRPVYIGEAENGMRHGLGSAFRYGESAVPEETAGYWENGALLFVRKQDELRPVGGYQPTKSSYSGEVDENGLPHGTGIMLLPDGRCYTGEFAHGKRRGEGKLWQEKGGKLLYSGEWRDDKRCGMGKGYAADGIYYEGEWLNGMRHGTGEAKVGGYSGFKVTGTWEQDRPVGRVKLSCSSDILGERYCEIDLSGDPRFDPLDKDQIEKMFSRVRSHVRHMKYSLSSQNGFSDSRYYDGNCYNGELDECGRPDGEGELVYSDKPIYVGQWQRGLPNGEGTFYCRDAYQHFRNPIIVKGRFVNGAPHGVCIRENTLEHTTERCVYAYGKVVSPEPVETESGDGQTE